jgi:predicted metal-dependent phosphoesterase TrpH
MARRSPYAAAISAACFDLQSHSTYSDGTLSPADVIARAADAGVDLVALTDHDTVDGVQEALDAGRRNGVGVVPAVEVSIVDPVADDLHVLGYGVDHRNPHLLDTLQRWRTDRASRAERMAARLRDLGFAIDDGVLVSRLDAGMALGRPHLAQAVLASAQNAERLADEEIACPGDFICAYLLAGRPAFEGRTHPDAAEAIALIHQAGGIAVWAHPFWDIAEPAVVLATLERLRGLGLDGVEAFYVTHDREQTQLLARAAARHGLLVTGSSDFHGPEHTRFSCFRAFELHGHAVWLGPLLDCAAAVAAGSVGHVNSGEGEPCRQSRSASA